MMPMSASQEPGILVLWGFFSTTHLLGQALGSPSRSRCLKVRRGWQHGPMGKGRPGFLLALNCKDEEEVGAERDCRGLP